MLIAASSRPSSSQTTGNQESDLTAIHAVTLKLPEFWTGDPEVRFVRVEAQFRSRAITLDSTKFDYVVTALDNRKAVEVKAIICQPPPLKQLSFLRSANHRRKKTMNFLVDVDLETENHQIYSGK